MKVKLAQWAGFCMGVRRAVEAALEAVHHRQGPIYSYGPLIHNPQAVDLLRSKGLIALDGKVSSLEGVEEGTVIIRAHGVPPEERRAIEAKGLEVIDATCPRVIRVQAIIDRHAAKGKHVLIWGDENHPEVVGLLGHAHGRGHVFRDPEELAGLPELEDVVLVAQTTQNKSKFPETAAAVRARWPEALVFDTICGATQRRQGEVARLCGEVDCMVVVGGHASGNTRRLVAAAQAHGVRTVHVETDDELDRGWFSGAKNIGVTAGASTPNWMIKRVIRKIERFGRKSDHSFRALSYRILRIFILSNYYVALGGGGLCLAGAALQGVPLEFGFFGAAFFYIHAMHLLNLFLDKEGSQYNDPDRIGFLERHKTALLTSGLVSAGLSLAFSLAVAPAVFFMLISMSALGLLYAVPIVPASFSRITRFRRLKDIPVSKTMSLSGGWAVSLSLIPALSPEGSLSWATLFVAGFIFILVFIRSALEDIIEIQGDRVVGRETIPIIIGEARTYRLLGLMIFFMTLILIVGRVAGVFNSLALLLLLCPAYAALFLTVYQRKQIVGSALFEAFIDGNFIMAGLLTGLWLIAGG